MSYQAQTWAINCRVGDPVLKLLLLTLANYTGTDDQCWHRQERISHDTEIPVRTLRRKLAALVEMGLIEITPRTRDDGTKASSLIRLMTDHQPAAKMASGESSGQNEGSPSAKNGGHPSANMVAEQESSLNLQEPPLDRHTRGREAERFFAERFWPNYPKRAGGNPKESARKKIVQLVTGGENPEIILDGLRRLVRGLRARQKVGSEFVPMAITWLNRKGWLDDPEPEMPAHQMQPNGGGGGFFAAAAQIRRNAGE